MSLYIEKTNVLKKKRICHTKEFKEWIDLVCTNYKDGDLVYFRSSDFRQFTINRKTNIYTGGSFSYHLSKIGFKDAKKPGKYKVFVFNRQILSNYLSQKN
jgi:hypothetical protein